LILVVVFCMGRIGKPVVFTFADEVSFIWHWIWCISMMIAVKEWVWRKMTKEHTGV
jgi:hypothetical protein